MPTLEEQRGGRSCGTCHWFQKRAEGSYAMGDGWCEYKPPPINREWGKHCDPVRVRDWCSCWLPNLAAME